MYSIFKVQQPQMFNIRVLLNPDCFQQFMFNFFKIIIFYQTCLCNI